MAFGRRIASSLYGFVRCIGARSHCADFRVAYNSKAGNSRRLGVRVGFRSPLWVHTEQDAFLAGAFESRRTCMCALHTLSFLLFLALAHCHGHQRRRFGGAARTAVACCFHASRSWRISARASRSRASIASEIANFSLRKGVSSWGREVSNSWSRETVSAPIIGNTRCSSEGSIE